MKDQRKRLDLLLRWRKNRMEEEARELRTLQNAIQEQNKKIEYLKEMYSSGLQSVNRERQTSGSGSLSIFEKSLDQVKIRWFEGMRKLRDLTKREELQRHNYVVAKNSYDALIKIQDKKEVEYRDHLDRVTQKQSDEDFVLKSIRRVGQ